MIAEHDRWLWNWLQQGISDPPEQFKPTNPAVVTERALETAHAALSRPDQSIYLGVAGYHFYCFDNTIIMLNSALQNASTSEYYNIPGWGQRFVGFYDAVCPEGHFPIQATSQSDIKSLYNLDEETHTELVHEVVVPIKVFCLRNASHDRKKNYRKQDIRRGNDVRFCAGRLTSDVSGSRRPTLSIRCRIDFHSRILCRYYLTLGENL